MPGIDPLEGSQPWPPSVGPAPEEGEPPLVRGVEGEGRRRSLSGWIERRAATVMAKLYARHSDDLQERARRAVSSAYQEHSDDIEERAVRAMRRALSLEAERFKEVIEHAVAVKKREVRLSLLVLLTAALVWFLLDWFANGNAGNGG